LEFLEAWNTIFFTEFKDYDDAIEKLSGKRHIASFVFMFYEEVGVLLRKKLIDIGLVEELLGTSAKQIWEKVKDLIEDARKRYSPGAYSHFEFLYNEMRKKEQRMTKKAA